jgi:hypothetical protein
LLCQLFDNGAIPDPYFTGNREKALEIPRRLNRHLRTAESSVAALGQSETTPRQIWYAGKCALYLLKSENIHIF